jgi:hypothetical protein
MTSTTERYPIKAKSLTLLELCDRINELRQTSPRSTARILTRRFHFHPLKIKKNAKQHSSKITANNLIEIKQTNQTNSEKKSSLSKRKSYRGLSTLSLSFPLTTHKNAKPNTSITTDHDNSNKSETSTTTISTNPVSLPPINQGISPSSPSKPTVSARPSSYIPNQQQSRKNRREKINVWRHLAHSLQRPIPKDPPTTPLDTLLDFQLQPIQKANLNAIQQIQIYKQKPIYNSITDESNNNEESN